jgi:tetratricopeptide (TPR) repeat protein
MWSRSNARRFKVARLIAGGSLACVLALLLSASSTHAQQQRMGGPDPAETYRIMMEERQRQTQRAVAETLRRRFEEHKDEGHLPASVAARPGVVRAATPEERAALAHTDKGLALFAKNKFEQAITEYNEAIRLYPTLAVAHNNLGSAYYALARYTEAVAAFRQATQLDSTYAQAQLNLALAYFKLGRNAEASEALNAAVKIYFAAGDEQLQAGARTEAEATYKELLQLDPDYAPAHQRLGMIYNADERYAAAVAAFQTVIKLQPQNADAHAALARSYLALHNYAAAADAATRAAQLQPQSPAPHLTAGLAHVALNQRTQAVAHYNRLKELHADEYARQLADAIERKTPPRP